MITFIFSCASLIYVYNFNQPTNLVKGIFDKNAVWTSFSQRKNYVENGFVAGFLYNLNAPAVEKPTNYSKKTIEGIVKKYEKIADEINRNRDGEIEEVNIIYVMSESFSDPKKIEGATVSQDPIPKTRSLIEKNLSGQMYSQGYGGGTANIEFEALTSFSMEPMAPSITTPYIQLTDKISKMPTIVSYLAERGYTTTAMHPYQVSMYKRTDVYKKMGFDYFIHEDNMENKEKLEHSPYISDESAYKEVLSHIAETPEKDFLHLVTMQNHGGYTGKYDQLDYKSEGLPNNEEAENYYKGLAYSDDFLADFIEQVSQLPEKTIVVFWGDHLPGFYGDDISVKNGRLKMHSTPLIIYSNFKENSSDLKTISPMYFMNHILEESNSSITPFYALTYKLESLLPAFEKELYLEEGASEPKSTRNMLSNETLEILEEYDAIEYDVTTGNNYLKNYDFFK
ncbi:LTA synthase family protein [Desemzia sp. FAM 24101]|uniref:LTA synthase family protein n=1 Tax=unclassified Desemzia TaxID=2685243 RepID=UPI003887EB81